MDSVTKVNCTRKDLEHAADLHLIEVRYFAFDIAENGFDPAILTPEQRECQVEEPYIYEVHVRHADFGTLEDNYSSLEELIGDISHRQHRFIREEFKKLRKQRGKEAQG